MIKFIQLFEYAVKPTPTPSGFDLHATKRVDIDPGQTCKMDSGLNIKIPKGYVGIIQPRSKLALDKNVRIGAQIVHHDYEGEVTIHLHNAGKDLVEIKHKDAVAQLIVVPCFTDCEYIGF